MELRDSEYPGFREVALHAARAAGAPLAWVEDIADEAVARLLQRDPPPDHPKAFIRTIARNLAIDRHRADPDAGFTDLPRSAPAPGEDAFPEQMREPAASLGGRARAKFGSLMRKLPDILSATELELLLASAQGFTVREIAEQHGYTEGSVRTITAGGRRKLRDAFPDPDLSV